MSSYLGLKNCHPSIYPRGICRNVILAAYLYAEGCIVFTFHLVCKAHIRVYNIVTSAVQISGLEYCLLSNALFRASVWTPLVRSYLGLQNYVYSKYPRGVCSIFYLQHICMVKGVLFSLFTLSIRLISGSTVLSPQQYWYLAWIIASSAMLFSWPLYWPRKWALYSACRTVFAAHILEMSAGSLYLWHICILKGLLFSFFSSSLGLISGLLIMSPEKCSNLGIRIDSLGEF